MVASHPFRRSSHPFGRFAVSGVPGLASGGGPAQESKPPSAASGVPTFDVDPHWPAPLPHNRVLGPVSGIGSDDRDHFIVIQRTVIDSVKAAGCDAAAARRIQKFRLTEPGG